MRSLVLVASLGACANTPHRLNEAGLALAALSIDCDAAQTSYAARSGNYVEHNPIMGTAPSESTVAMYMASSLLVTGAAWYLLPERWKPLAWGSVAAVELDAVAGNMQARQPVPLCGL